MHYVIFVNLPILAVRLLLKAKYFQFPQAVYRMYSARLKVVADDVDFPLSEMEDILVYISCFLRSHSAGRQFHTPRKSRQLVFHVS